MALIALSLRADAQEFTASITGNCKSMWFEPLVYGANRTYFTTYDGKSEPPLLNYTAANPTGVSNEFRSRDAAGTEFETDFLTYSFGRLSSYGSVVVTVPLTDKNANGLNDILEQSQSIDTRFSGTIILDWPSPGAAAISGRITRAAGASKGLCSLTFPDGTVANGSYEVLSLAGSVTYARVPQNHISYSLTLVDDGGPHFLQAQGSFTVVNADDVMLTSGLFSSEDGDAVAMIGAGLKRVGTSFRGDLTVADGFPLTSWTDYANWFVTITDQNDGDSDGIPNLSDNPRVNSPPVVSLIRLTQGETTPGGSLEILANAGDSDGTIKQVQFWMGPNLVGTDTVFPFSITLPNMDAGIYTISAVAEDNDGASTRSDPLRVAVAVKPSLASPLKTGGGWQVGVAGSSGLLHTIEATTDLRTWTPIGTVTPFRGAASFNISPSGTWTAFRAIVK